MTSASRKGARIAGRFGFSHARTQTHMLELFHKGGPIMWPLLLLSIVALTVLLERLVFIARVRDATPGSHLDAPVRFNLRD